MPYSHPAGLIAGFHAQEPEADVPELVHVGEQWMPRRYQIPTHAHPVWEFYLQLDGESVWEGSGQDYTLQAGGFFAAPPAAPHRLREARNAKHHFFFAALDLPVVLRRLPGLESAWREEVVCVSQGNSLAAPFRHLIREVSLTLPYRTLGIRTALDGLVVEASRLREKTGGASSFALQHPAVCRARELLEQQPGLPWRLADLARQTGLSANHLAECFTREVGVAPHQYLLQVRLVRAQEMLRQTALPITELALELGFASGQHFAVTFKRLTGKTPRQYRQGEEIPA